MWPWYIPEVEKQGICDSKRKARVTLSEQASGAWLVYVTISRGPS